ncbi:Putative GroES-like superfamily, alcohol dehydrogenase-like, NAD(P)-binding domain superfamily [Septoria linicola]|uniref:GroES-like superfamily, alcohol dehydrogenase-like, NAD(P)-binding domain superfamily n=1 Tax=Septoria linicola TaxID=215465 RepID=A0A9Q9EPW7_9PEZI|nr:putative GroES-like superfamily, alcohol dehydrogenase-like, NAD(P)-binding domain superfamily [Septoria linicola]USW59206.1 Putative GroES-like superfamily, alcohol dehydrogenase-like, NAD(P)-binding domain superfamily [Septoria linicola]
MAPPSKIKAITIDGNKAKVSEISLPKVRPTYLLAKVEAIALNPTDWKHINGKRAADNGLAGCDFAGTVVEVGSDVSKHFQPGDRIAGTTHGANFSQPEDGCFAEYAVAKADLLVKIPSSLSFEQAATFPLGVSTVGQGLYQKALKLNLPTDPIPKDSQTLLIYGGSTATGSLAIQFAKLSGYKVLTTCSPHNNDFVKSLGADAVYNYKDSDVGKQINRDTNDSLKLIWDTISLEASAKICDEALSSDSTGAKYHTILPVKLPSRGKDVETMFTFMYTIFNEPFTKAGRDTPAIQEDFDFAKKFFQITEDLLKEGKLKTHPEQVGKEGLKGALQGMLNMKNEKVSGKKLVYRVAETPADAVGSAEVEL